jgi:hypothetical protein
MSDVTLPRPTATWTGWYGPALKYVALVLALLVASLIARDWSADQSKSETEQRCERTKGAFSSGFSSGFDVDRCHCKTPSLDFSDACNSMYLRDSQIATAHFPRRALSR